MKTLYADREEGTLGSTQSFYGTAYAVTDGTYHAAMEIQDAASRLRALCKALGRGDIPQEQFVNELELIITDTRKAVQTAARYDRKRKDYEAAD